MRLNRQKRLRPSRIWGMCKMAATIIDGKALAAKVKAQTAEAAKSLYRRPGLAVILVGNDPASRVYVTGKEKDCAECGFLSFEHALPEDTTQETLLDLIQEGSLGLWQAIQGYREGDYADYRD